MKFTYENILDAARDKHISQDDLKLIGYEVYSMYLRDDDFLQDGASCGDVDIKFIENKDSSLTFVRVSYEFLNDSVLYAYDLSIPEGNQQIVSIQIVKAVSDELQVMDSFNNYASDDYFDDDNKFDFSNLWSVELPLNVLNIGVKNIVIDIFKTTADWVNENWDLEDFIEKNVDDIDCGFDISNLSKGYVVSFVNFYALNELLLCDQLEPDLMSDFVDVVTHSTNESLQLFNSNLQFMLPYIGDVFCLS